MTQPFSAKTLSRWQHSTLEIATNAIDIQKSLWYNVHNIKIKEVFPWNEF